MRATITYKGTTQRPPEPDRKPRASKGRGGQQVGTVLVVVYK
ncbi:MAG TPA: hypothetical protein VEA78_08025 [Acidimicrobiales bacterium]|nr:hypothetical protein [Acidimicrobiales bacterium]